MMRFLQDRKKLVRLLLTLAVLAVIGPYCYVNTRPTQITVIVRDSETGAFLPDTLIQVQNANGQELISFVTDENGYAGVKRLEPGSNYRVLAQRIDYVPAIKFDVALELHQTTEVRIPLRRQAGGRLYVGLDRAYIASFDTASNLVVSFDTGPDGMRTWPVRFCAAHPRFPWIYASARYISYMLEPNKMDAVAELSLPGSVLGWRMTASSDRLLALVRDRPTDQLVIIDPELGREVTRVLPDAEQRLPEKLEEVYVLDHYLAIRQDATWQLHDLRPLLADALPDFRFSWAALSADMRTLYCGHADQSQLYALDVGTWTIKAVAEVGKGMVAATTSLESDQLYLVNQALGLLLVLDADTLQLILNVPVGKGPLALALDPAGKRLYIANHESRNVSIMDVATNRVFETLDVGLRPFSIAVR